MDPKQKTAKLWKTLLGQAEEANDSNDRVISRRMGRSEDFLAVSRHRRRGASLENFVRLLQAAGEPEWAVAARLFPAPEGPAETLRRLRAHNRSLPAAQALPPPLDRLEEVCAGLERLRPAATGGVGRQVRGRLAGIDRMRHRDPAAGRRLVETELNTQLLQLQSAKGADRAAAAALAVAVAIWADEQRREGRQELAGEACPKALDLAELAGDRWALAYTLEAAALLAQELGLPGYALAWLERAGFCFALENELAPLPRILAAQGRILADLGRYPAAAVALRDAVARLSEADRHLWHPALLALADTEQCLGRPLAALSCLERLAREHQAEDMVRRDLLWRQAGLKLAAGNTQAAVLLLGQGVVLTLRAGRPVDVGYVLVEIAQRLLAAGATEPLELLASAALERIEEPARHRRLVEVVEDLFALTRLRRLREADLEGIRRRLEEIGPPPAKGWFPAGTKTDFAPKAAK